VGFAAAILVAAALTKPPPGQCEGIGWGCNLYGGDAAAFAAIFVVPIALALLLGGNAIIALVGRAVRKSSNRSEPLGTP
jgi:hypothetical protein